jgi:hypothetical protein
MPRTILYDGNKRERHNEAERQYRLRRKIELEKRLHAPAQEIAKITAGPINPVPSQAINENRIARQKAWDSLTLEQKRSVYLEWNLHKLLPCGMEQWNDDDLQELLEPFWTCPHCGRKVSEILDWCLKCGEPR